MGIYSLDYVNFRYYFASYALYKHASGRTNVSESCRHYCRHETKSQTIFSDHFKLPSFNNMLFSAFLKADIHFWQLNIISAAINAAIIYIFKKFRIRGTFSLFIIFSQNQFPLLYRPISDKSITSATMRMMLNIKNIQSHFVGEALYVKRLS